MRLDAPFQQPLPPVSRELEPRSPARLQAREALAAPETAPERDRGRTAGGIAQALAAADSQQRQREVLDSDNVAPRNRGAIAAYLANVPGPLERLGVELVGVDILA